MISQLLSGRSALRLGSLTPVRDFNFVTDTVDGFVRAACAEEVAGELICLGHGAGITVGDLAQRIMHLAGVEIPFETDDRRIRPEKSEVMALICNNAKAKRLLGWQPRVSLDEGLKLTIEFVREHMEQFKSEEYGL